MTYDLWNKNQENDAILQSNYLSIKNKYIFLKAREIYKYSSKKMFKKEKVGYKNKIKGIIQKKKCYNNMKKMKKGKNIEI